MILMLESYTNLPFHGNEMSCCTVHRTHGDSVKCASPIVTFHKIPDIKNVSVWFDDIEK